MVYGSTVFLLGAAGNASAAYAVNAATGRQLWATPIKGPRTGIALGPSGNVMALSSTTLTAINRTTGKASWTFPLPPGAFATHPPLVDGSGDTYVLAGLQAGGGTVIALSPTGQQLWENNIGTPSTSIFGPSLVGGPNDATIGVDGSIYVSASDGNVYAFTDPS